MQIDKNKLKFYLKYLIPYGQLDKFQQRLNSMMLAVTINPDTPIVLLSLLIDF